MRVACPARGTTLAGERLDRYLSIILNLITSIPGFSNPVTELVKAFTLAVVNKRTEPSQLPGLEAMMPSAPLIQLLTGHRFLLSRRPRPGGQHPRHAGRRAPA